MLVNLHEASEEVKGAARFFTADKARLMIAAAEQPFVPCSQALQ